MFRPSCCERTRHIWLLIKLTGNLGDELKQIIDPINRRNAYFSHPENIILSIITDADEDKSFRLEEDLRIMVEQK